MKKFVIVSICICMSLWLFIIGSKIFFEDMIHYKDYIDKNKREIKMVYDSQRESKNGIYVRLKAINHSKFRFLLTNAKLGFPSYNSDGDLDILLELKLDDLYEGKNEKIMVEGIEKYEEGYVTFLIPKGIILDEKYFDLDAVCIEYDGVFKMKLPFLENKYISISSYSGNALVSNREGSININ